MPYWGTRGFFDSKQIKKSNKKNKLITNEQIIKILKLNEICKDKDYLSSMLKMLKKDSIFSLTYQEGNQSINQIKKWNKACCKRQQRKLKRNKKKQRKPKRIHVKNYQEYLKSEHWQTVKLQLKKRYCFICQSTKNLHLHHKNYKCLGKETDEDVVTLCDNCHKEVHELAENKSNKLDIDTAVGHLTQNKK